MYIATELLKETDTFSSPLRKLVMSRAIRILKSAFLILQKSSSTPEQKQEIEHFKFYQRYAYSGNDSPLGWPLKRLSRWRLSRRNYALPVERRVLEWLRPQRALS